MQTLTQPTVSDRSNRATGRSARRPWIAVAISAAAMAVVVGVLAIGGGEAGDVVDDVVVANGNELSPRQERMIEVVDAYVAAWQANDGELAAEYMTENGVVQYLEGDWTLRPDDGTLASWVGSPRYATLRLIEPRVVHDDRVVLTGEVEAIDARFVSIVEFTTVGEPLIVSETIDHWYVTD